MAMKKGLQKHMVAKLLQKNGISPDVIDIEAEVDSNLTLEENLKILSKKLGIPLTKALKEIELNKADEYFEEEKNKDILEEYLMMNDIDLSDFEEETEGAGDIDTDIDDVELLEEEIDLHKEQIAKLLSDLVEKQDPMDYFSRYLFPEIVGSQYDAVRKAVLLMLATRRDKKKRTRIHILLVGKAGSGKTEILLWLQNKLGAHFVNAEHTSKIGLSGDARGKEITAGALAEAHGNILCIDELDKMSVRDQSALLQAMEEGRYTITKGKFRERFKAEVRVVATANDITKIQKPLLDRFDFIFNLDVPSREERAKNVDHLVEQFFDMFDAPKGDIIREYLGWVHDFDPSVEKMDKIKEVMRSYIKLTSKELSEASYRSLELSILRIAYALAKLRRKNVTPVDVVKAIRMKDESLTNEQFRYLMAIGNGELKF